MTLRSEVIAMRELEEGEPVGYSGRWRAPRRSRIAVVACGYGDGYDRHARDGTPVLVNGQRCAIAGKVSMDMLTVDVTDVPDAVIGSEVVLWGRASNGVILPVDEVARYCDTISYTLLTGYCPGHRGVIMGVLFKRLVLCRNHVIPAHSPTRVTGLPGSESALCMSPPGCLGD
ncbi:hypothetical protein HSBAA_49630 [Vreelandella sulfidaeris]|uniref:Alanine racemase C-terminal domain-containing protein n=1 Tax=Vreelandella sulfidaeris TaxID=115553 RepID=A0A455UDF2_9GAMM|nr:hypothetical protein HSBAA_49630 [Halomonas sulfidaeris]